MLARTMGHSASRQMASSPTQPVAVRRRRLGLFRRGSAIAVAPADGGPTHGQILRGHGPAKKQGAGWGGGSDVSPELQALMLTYGQMTQATYDCLGLDRSNEATWGYVSIPPSALPKASGTDPTLLDYLTDDYPLAPGAPPPVRGSGVASKYRLPDAAGKSPIIYALPGKDTHEPDKSLFPEFQRLQQLGGWRPWGWVLMPVAAPLAVASVGVNALLGGAGWLLRRFRFLKPYVGPLYTVGKVLAWLLVPWRFNVDNTINTVSGLLVTVVSNSDRRLFLPDPATGRGQTPRGAFMGYVAVSEPSGEADEVDVALVWRGTIFREEWESNFSEDQLVPWKDTAEKAIEQLSPENSAKIEAIGCPPWEIGVHDGFSDLYNRQTQQSGPNGPVGPTLSPRQAVQAWLVELMTTRNVTTITSTGHSLGGALSTLCAFDVAQWLEANWDNLPKQGWATQAKPKVTLLSWASPKVGNPTFARKMKELDVSVMRVVNRGDVVPVVPGLLGTALNAAFGRIPGFTKTFRGVYYAASLLCWPVFPSRWGYFHAGDSLVLDPAIQVGEGKPLKADLSTGNKHNLELYMFLVSQLVRDGSAPARNLLLLNKSDNLLADETIPVDWWRYAERRGMDLKNGRWTHTHPTS